MFSDVVSVTFPECSKYGCITIPIINDEALEDIKQFEVILNELPGHDDRIMLTDTVKIVEIFDDDCK